MTAPQQGTLARAQEHIANATDALHNLEGTLYAIEHRRYTPNGADYIRWMLDDLEEAAHALRELLAAESN